MNLLGQVWAILLPAERRRASVVLGVMLLTAVVETLSVGAVLPVLAFMTGDAAGLPPYVRERLGNVVSEPSPRTAMVILLGLVVVYAAKAVFLLGAAYVQARYVRSVQANVSRRLFSAVIAQPWTFHMRRNTATTMHVVEESQSFSQVCTHLLQILSESLVGVALLGLLFWLAPVAAMLVATMLGVAIWLLAHFVRPRSRRWAEARHHHGRMLRQHVQQVFAGVKEVKIHGCEQEVTDDFRTSADAASRNATFLWVVEQMPRPGFELLAVVTLMMLTAVTAWHGGSMRSLLPMLGLYATVAFRMLPSINHATIAAQRLRHAEPMLASLRQDLALEGIRPAPVSTAPVTFRDRIRLERVSYRYPESGDDVLRDVDLVIPYGATVGIIGESGAGKSTLVDVLLGLLPPTTGRVTVDGVDIRHHVRGWHTVIGYVPQSIYLLDHSIRRNVAFGVPEHAIDDGAVARALAGARLDDFVGDLPNGAHTVVGERGVRLSGGQRQRIAIARALYGDPQLLVLDEATSALDTVTEAAIMATVEALHGTKTVVIVTHRLSTVGRCDVLHHVENGRITRSGSFATVVPDGP